ncbi:MAG: Curculin domain protein (mannose-binding) lectin [Subtercola sp.]|nr:Curculin domain protein (mannose-binding) lectin [Subtercola sp.]
MNTHRPSRSRGPVPALLVGIFAVVVGLGVLMPATADAASIGAVQGVAVADKMNGGEQLTAGEQLTSGDHTEHFAMQGDGNAVVYGSSSQALWNTQTFAVGSRIVMQTDGNLVLYTPSGSAAWNSGTFNHPGAYAVMQNDGNLVIYGGGSALWNSFAASRPAAPAVKDTLNSGEQLSSGAQLASGPNVAVMQGDGNFVVYAAGLAPWSSRTNNGNRLVMQTDGNAVVYTSGGNAVWNSGTAGHSGARLVMQSDGNLVIYGSGGALWNSFAANRPVTPPPASAPPQSPGQPSSVYYENCAAARAAHAAPIYRGQPGYRAGLDGDNDGVACE